MDKTLSPQSSCLQQDAPSISPLPVRLYHAGFQVIEKPDIHHGRRNADFGQDFYLTPDEDFAVKWAREQKGSHTYINRYDFDWDGLSVVRLQRDSVWFGCLRANRAGASDPPAPAARPRIHADRSQNREGRFPSSFCGCPGTGQRPARSLPGSGFARRACLSAAFC